MQHLTTILVVHISQVFFCCCWSYVSLSGFLMNLTEHMSQNLLFLIDCEIFKQVQWNLHLQEVRSLALPAATSSTQYVCRCALCVREYLVVPHCQPSQERILANIFAMWRRKKEKIRPASATYASSCGHKKKWCKQINKNLAIVGRYSWLSTAKLQIITQKP